MLVQTRQGRRRCLKATRMLLMGRFVLCRGNSRQPVTVLITLVTDPRHPRMFLAGCSEPANQCGGRLPAQQSVP